MLPEQTANVRVVASEHLGLPDAITAAMKTAAPGAPTWQADAVAGYALESEAYDTQLRTELAARIYRLTGCSISSDAITVNREVRCASTTLDGVVFQLHGHEVIIARPCSYCGVGRFESPPIRGRAVLGHALIGWRPYHVACEPTDPTDDGADY